MVEKKLLVLAIFCLVLTVGLVKLTMTLNDNKMEIQIKSEELIQIESENNIIESQLSNMEKEIASLINEIESLEIQVSNLRSEKSQFEILAINSQSETAELKNELINLESQVSILQEEQENLKNEIVQNYNLGYDEGESEGYQSGYDEGFNQGIDFINENGWYSRDPTFDEAVAFINADNTEQNEYSIPDYVCYDFSADFNANALDSGYRCGFVYIEFIDSAHAIVCFNTTDQGLIFVEPQTDEVLTLTIGQVYLGNIIRDISLIW